MVCQWARYACLQGEGATPRPSRASLVFSVARSAATRRPTSSAPSSPTSPATASADSSSKAALPSTVVRLSDASEQSSPGSNWTLIALCQKHLEVSGELVIAPEPVARPSCALPALDEVNPVVDEQGP